MRAIPAFPVLGQGTGPDSIVGTDGNDTLYGDAGDDTIAGLGGDDWLYGGAGADSLSGGDGSDRLSANGGGYDVLDGGNGNDTLLLRDGTTALGGAGDDEFAVSPEYYWYGPSLGMVATGGAGADLYGAESRVYPDNDPGFVPWSIASAALHITDFNVGEGDRVALGLRLLPGPTLWRGAAADGFTGAIGQSAGESSGAFDVWSFSDGVSSGFYIDLDVDGVVGQWDFVLRFDNVAHVDLAAIVDDFGDWQIGTAGNDTDTTPALGAGDDSAYGLSGNDTLNGGAGEDTIRGGRGDDRLRGGSGRDEVDGGSGNDWIHVGLGADGGEYAFGGTGSDTLVGGDGLDFLFTGDLFDDQRPDAPDTVNYAFGQGGTDYIHGAGGRDWLYGGTGDDHLDGYAGGDFLDGGDGKDALNGGAGADTMYGGDGDDSYIVDSAGDLVIEYAGEGIDQVSSSLDTYVLRANFENLRLFGAGNLDGTGNLLDNLLVANVGDNVLDGRTGNDTVSYRFSGAVSVSLAYTTAQATGGSGTDTLVNIENLIGSNYADTLRGNALANRIDGSEGRDWLLGGGGQDTLSGGTQADFFVFSAAAESTLAAMDTIADFSRQQYDKLDVSRIDANATLAGNQAFTFIGGAAFSADATAQLRYAGGILYGSVDADADAEFAIALTGAPTLLAADLLL
jgi:Ca2+-binding RTX toxin-like protein